MRPIDADQGNRGLMPAGEPVDDGARPRNGISEVKDAELVELFTPIEKLLGPKSLWSNSPP